MKENAPEGSKHQHVEEWRVPVLRWLCPNGWTAISLGGEKRIKAWYAADVLNDHIVTALVIWFEVLGGGVLSGLML